MAGSGTAHCICFATVWLGQSSEDSRCYALKILCAEVSDVKYHEKQVMQHIDPHNQSERYQVTSFLRGHRPQWRPHLSRHPGLRPQPL